MRQAAIERAAQLAGDAEAVAEDYEEGGEEEAPEEDEAGDDADVPE